MNGGNRARGKPLIALGVVLGLWVAMRFALYDAAVVPLAIEVPKVAVSPAQSVIRNTAGRAQAPSRPIEQTHEDNAASTSLRQTAPWPRSPGPAVGYQPPQINGDVWHWDEVPLSQYPATSLPKRTSSAQAGAHHMLWLAALSRMPLPERIAASPTGSPAPFVAIDRRSNTRESRWSADAWVFLRRGGEQRFAGGPSSATYGASQAGAVARYRLVPSSPHRPTAYLRATSALGLAERDVAVGLSARPIASVPVRAAAELRASEQGRRTQVRPAAMLITEIRPVDLPAQTRGEFYAQAGYVGGRFATPFVDGQLRIDREAVRVGDAVLRAGGATWGGAQKGASRLDIGPTASVTVAIGESAAARVAVDWRFRVAGDARPGSGPALTLSAGF